MRLVHGQVCSGEITWTHGETWGGRVGMGRAHGVLLSDFNFVTNKQAQRLWRNGGSELI